MYQPHQAIRLQQDDQDQQQSIKQEVNLGEIHNQFFFHNTKDSPAQHWSPDCADAANDRHQENGNPGLECEHATRPATGINELRITGVNCACNAGERSSNCVCP